tara:strand:+ start:103 stop:600 length:498 start_codon:yes stop_codon:yes gene_type:complete
MKEKGCVYFFKHVGLSPIKIGYSTNPSPIERFSQFKTYAPFGAELIGFIPTIEAKELETSLHNKLSAERLEGEWFDIKVSKAMDIIEKYTSIEDVKRRNEFEIAYCKELEADAENNKFDVILNRKDWGSKEKVIALIRLFPELTKTEIASQVGVSRKTLYNYLKN